nr:protein YgfX [Sulfuriferula thiophila]
MSAHALALLATWLAAVAPPWQIGGTLLLTTSAIYYFQQLRQSPISAIEADETGYRLLHQGLWVDADLLQAFVTAPLTVIQFKLTSGVRVAVPLLVDSMGVDDYRHLRVWLRWVRYGGVD